MKSENKNSKRLQFLVLEDEAVIRKFIASQLQEYGRVFEAANKQEALNILKNVEPDIAFVDLNLSADAELEGLDIVEKCSSQEIPTVVLSSFEEKEIYQLAYEKGAKHFFSKKDLTGQGNEQHSIINFIKTLLPDDLEDFFGREFVTQDFKLKADIKFLREQLLNYQQAVLLTGPTGVGKTKIARYLHNLVGQEKPFVGRNLSELSESLFETELFGHKKGAFTGADQDKQGLLEKANGGTLFLDEVATLSLPVQQKLLKVLEEKKFTPLGDTRERFSDFALICASCEDLQEKIEKKEMRSDFYYRIKGLEVHISPLRERQGDIIPLIDHFILAEEKKIVFSKEAQAKLEAYAWPGNVRELRAFVKECMSYPKGHIEVADLPDYM